MTKEEYLKLLNSYPKKYADAGKVPTYGWGGTLGGVAGGVLGTLIAPGIGTTIGASIGGGLGSMAETRVKENRMIDAGQELPLENGNSQVAQDMVGSVASSVFKGVGGSQAKPQEAALESPGGETAAPSYRAFGENGEIPVINAPMPYKYGGSIGDFTFKPSVPISQQIGIGTPRGPVSNPLTNPFPFNNPLEDINKKEEEKRKQIYFNYSPEKIKYINSNQPWYNTLEVNSTNNRIKENREIDNSRIYNNVNNKPNLPSNTINTEPNLLNQNTLGSPDFGGNLSTPDMNLNFAKYGGMVKYAMGGQVFTPNAEIEDGELDFTTDGRTTYHTGDEHGEDTDGDGREGIQRELEPGTKILSNRLKYKGKTFADMGKKYNNDKYQKILDNPQASQIEKDTANMMMKQNHERLESIYALQDQMKIKKGLPSDMSMQSPMQMAAYGAEIFPTGDEFPKAAVDSTIAARGLNIPPVDKKGRQLGTPYTIKSNDFNLTQNKKNMFIDGQLQKLDSIVDISKGVGLGYANGKGIVVSTDPSTKQGVSDYNKSNARVMYNNEKKITPYYQLPPLPGYQGTLKTPQYATGGVVDPNKIIYNPGLEASETSPKTFYDENGNLIGRDWMENQFRNSISNPGLNVNRLNQNKFNLMNPPAPSTPQEMRAGYMENTISSIDNPDPKFSQPYIGPFSGTQRPTMNLNMALNPYDIGQFQPDLSNSNQDIPFENNLEITENPKFKYRFRPTPDTFPIPENQPLEGSKYSAGFGKIEPIKPRGFDNSIFEPLEKQLEEKNKYIPKEVPVEPEDNKKPIDWKKYAELAAMYGPTAYNLIRGTLGKKDKLDRRAYTVDDRLKYRDINIDPALRAIDEQSQVANTAIGGAGSSTGAMLSRKADLSTNAGAQKAKLMVDAQNTNNQGRQGVDQFNIGMEEKTQRQIAANEDYNKRAKAQKDTMAVKGLEGVSSITQMNKLMGNQKGADDVRLATLNSILSNYDISPELIKKVQNGTATQEEINSIFTLRKNK